MNIPTDIERIARNVRRTILRRYEWPDGRCKIASRLLRDKLRRVGYRASICWGKYDGYGHWWCRVNGKVLDVTSDQFPLESGRAIVYDIGTLHYAM